MAAKIAQVKMKKEAVIEEEAEEGAADEEEEGAARIAEAKRLKEAARKRERVRKKDILTKAAMAAAAPGLSAAKLQQDAQQLQLDIEALRLRRIANDQDIAANALLVKADEKAAGWIEVGHRK